MMGSAVACLALVVVTLHIFVDTIATKFFNAPIDITHTAVTRYYMVGLVFLALANVELRDGHIKADLFYSVLPDGMKRWVRGLNLLLLAGFTALLTWQVLLKAIAQTARGEKRIVAGVEYIYWPSRWIAVAGMFAFAMVAAVKLIQFLMRDEDGAAEAPQEGDQ
ncbi:TRAP transporter small permease [Pseudoprimorskyibacter insulae]|uniref:TRAP transporter small permease protein n=1 Tax=Pseudoprimorskyibacter insulae TaxID=1695997 RepID=A0A2R8AW68_9RHOB|nr:TRAP transporter small permease [Pseudoprimorskyibacter insulae]SPF80276.1 hypothetical protein PRI8871_02082 [Pseudoprimorskyibacter insulae]